MGGVYIGFLEPPCLELHHDVRTYVRTYVRSTNCDDFPSTNGAWRLGRLRTVLS